MRNKIVIIFTLLLCSLSSIFGQLSWTKLPGPPTGNIRDVVVNSAGTIFLAHGDFLNDGGMYRSTNNGLNFQKMFPGPGTDVRSLCWDKANDAYYTANGNFGVKKSINNCLTWTDAGLNSGSADKIICDKNSKLFASVYAYLHQSTNGGNSWQQMFISPSVIKCINIDSLNNLFVGTNGNGVYKSTNNGVNWVNSLPGKFINYMCVNSLNIMYAGTNDSGLYVSTNSGINWNRVNAPFSSVTSVYTVNNIIIVSTNIGIFKSINNGNSWESNVPEIFDGTTFVTDVQNNLLMGTEYGIYKSTNTGQTWSNLGLFITNIEDVKATQNGNIYTITYANEPFENLIWRSDDVGYTWKRILKTSEFLDKIEVDNLNRVFICSSNGVLMSSNNGVNWNNIGPSGLSINRVRINSISYLFACFNNGIMKSTNLGANWSDCSPVIQPFRSMTIDPSNNIFTASYYTGNNTSIIYKSTNSGNSWVNLGNPESPVSGVNSIVSDYGGNIYTQIIYSIYKSTNSGSSWMNTGFNGTSYNLYSNPDNSIYFTINNPWRTTNGGISYQELTGAGGSYCLTYHPSDIMIVGTQTGLFKSSSLTGIDPISNANPNDFIILQNYPNPFNPKTIINFDISSFYLNGHSNVKLIVYDALGKQIETLIDSKLNAGQYEIEWDASNYSSGIYYCQLTTNGFSKVRKMLLVK